MADRRFSIQFDAMMNTGDIQKSALQIQKAAENMKNSLTNMKMPPALSTSITKNFADLTNEITKFQNILSQGIGSSKDFDQLANSGERIAALYDKLGSQIKNLKGISQGEMKKLFPEDVANNINKATAAYEKYQNATKNNKSDSEKLAAETKSLEKAIESLIQKKEKLTNKQAIQDTTFQQMERDAEAARKKLEELQKQQIALQSQISNKEDQFKGKVDKNGRAVSPKTSKEYRQMLQDMQSLNAEIAKADTTLAKLENRKNKAFTQSQKDASLAGLNKELTEAEGKLEELKAKMADLGKGDQTAFKQLLDQLNQIAGIKLDPATASLDQVKAAIQGLSDQAFNNLINSFNQAGGAVNGMGTPIQNLIQQLYDLRTEVKNTDSQMNQINMLKSRVEYFFGLTNSIYLLRRAIKSSFNTIKELDAAMTETAVVTDFSVGDMWDKLPQYAQQANALGTSVKSLYEATTLYYQQGLNSSQAMGVGVETMKMARIANMDAAAATEAMTAALRGFNMEINEASATRINDVYSQLAAITASDTEQIATAMTKTASIAYSANMEFETTAALLSQIIETTQEAPETAGTAMKTIIARFTEVKQLFSEGMLTGEDEEGEVININKIDAALKTVGISLKDFLNGTKGIDDIFLELASKWDTLDLATQRYIATTAAGSRQQSRFIAMMSNYDRTMELVNAANNSAGASQNQFNKTLESLESKLQRLSNAWQEFTMGLANSDFVKGAVDGLAKILEALNKITGSAGSDGLGGFITMMLRFGTVMLSLRVGSKIFDGIFKVLGSGSKQLGGISKGFLGLGRNIGEAAAGASKASGAFLNLSGIGSKIGAAFAGIGKSILTVAASFLKIAVVAAVVAAAIWLIKAAFDKLHDATPEGKLEAAQEATQRAGEAAEEASKSYNNLKASLDSLDSKYATLDELTKGTQEWKDQVRELNNEVLDLINTYPELAQFVTSSGGVLKIDYEKQSADGTYAKDVIQQKEDMVYMTKAAQSLARVAEIDAQNAVDYNDILPKLQAYSIKYSEKEVIDAVSEALASGEITIKPDGSYDIQSWINSSKYAGSYLQANNTGEIASLYYEDLRKYGQQRINQQREKDLLIDSAVTSAMTMANLQQDSSEQVMGLDKDLLRAQMEESIKLGKAQYNILSDADRAKYAEAMGWTYSNGQFYNANKDNITKNVSNEEIQNYLGNLKGSEIMTSSLELISQNLSDMGEVGETLGSLISDEGSGISAELVKGFAEKGPESINELLRDASLQLSGNGDIGAQNKMAKQFGFNDRNGLVSLIKENLLIANERQMKERVKLGKELKKYDKAFNIYGEGDLENHAIANFLKWQEDNRGAEFTESFASLIDSISDSGDEGIIEQAITKFREMSGAMDGNKLVYNTEELQAVSDLVSEINWNNPIQAAARLNEEIQSGTPATREYAESLLQVENSVLGAGSQMRYFLESADYSDLKEDIEETIDAQGELSGMDVYQLAESCESLQTMMENTGITAEGLAQTLTMINDGTIGMHQLTDAVMAAMSGFESLDSIIYSALNGIEKFDAGMNENDIADFIGTAHETISGNIQKGAWGNSQNDRYLDFLLGSDWDKVGDGALSGKEYEQRMKYASDQLGKNKNNMGASWRQLAEGKNFWGEQTGTKLSDGFTYLGENPVEGSGLRVKKNYDGSVRLEGFEGMTTDQLVSELANAYGITEQYAEMMLGDFANYSSDIRQSLDLNDFTKGIEQAYEKTRSINFGSSDPQSSYKIIDESEIEAIAKAYGKTAKEVRKEFEEKGSLISQFYGEDGQIKDTEGIISELNRLASETTGIENLDFAKGFTDLAFTEDRWANIVDYDGMMQALEQLNLPDSVKSDIANSLVQSASDGAEGASTVIEATLSDGKKYPIEVEPGQTVQQAIAKMEKQIDNADLADAIKTAFQSIDLQFTFTDESTIQAQSQIAALQETANNTPVEVTVTANTEQATEQVGAFKAEMEAEPVSITVNTVSGTTDNPENTTTTNTIVPTVDSGAAAQITSDIGNAVSAANTTVNIKANTSSITSAINSAIPSTKTISVNVKLNQSTIEVSGAASATISLRAYKDGLEKAMTAHPALVSEEGPELIQTKDGAYLSGLNGPEIVNINRGDKVYTAKETKDILSNKKHNVIPRFSGGTSYAPGSGGGSGGTGVTTGSGRASKGSDKEWENPYDMLYNLINYIERTIRERERIERRYERLLEEIGTTAEEIYNVSVEQLEKLDQEKVAQEEKKQKRQQQIIDEFDYHSVEWLSKWFIPQNGEDGQQKTDYYYFDENGELVFEIDWDKINAEKSTGMGEAIEEFITKLEEWADSIEETNDAIADIEDMIAEINERGKEQYADIEERIHDALTSVYQQQIDSLSNINESINNTNSELISAIQKSVSKMRQERENERTEQDLAEKYRRLAYLKQNSSGNELEIKRLEEEIEKQQESYTDTLVDQKITELQEQNDLASKQREMQIEIAQANLDQLIESGEIWKEIHRLMTEGLSYTGGVLDSELLEILKASEEYRGKSEMQQVEWLKELNQTVAEALAYIKMNFSGYNMDSVYDQHETGDQALPYGVYRQYATGGLADYTGPAWLDGTPSKPELILNARDTENFIQLKDILGSVLNSRSATNAATSENSGDNIYDIDINIESVTSDYDVERMAKKIETLINENARYRNNNAISLKR